MALKEIIYEGMPSYPLTVLTSQESGDPLDAFDRLDLDLRGGNGVSYNLEFTADGGASWVQSGYSRTRVSDQSTLSDVDTLASIPLHERNPVGVTYLRNFGLAAPTWGYGMDHVDSFGHHFWYLHKSAVAYNGLRLSNGSNGELLRITGRRKTNTRLIRTIDMVAEHAAEHETLMDGEGRTLDAYGAIDFVFTDMSGPTSAAGEHFYMRRKSDGQYITPFGEYPQGYWGNDADGIRYGWEALRALAGHASPPHAVMSIWNPGLPAPTIFRKWFYSGPYTFAGCLAQNRDVFDGIKFDMTSAPTAGKCFIVGELI